MAKKEEQIKTITIAILGMVILIIVAFSAHNYFQINPSEASDENPFIIHNPLEPEVLRTWPSLTVRRSESAPILSSNILQTSDNEDKIRIQQISPTPIDPIPANNPYAFINGTVGNMSYGKIYYTKGLTIQDIPELIYDGNGMSPVPSGNYVFFIRIDSTDIYGFPTSTTPVKMDLRTMAITDLADTQSYPVMWNYLVPADNGSTYIYGAVDIGLINYLHGWTHIVKDDVEILKFYGSTLFPTLSSDGLKAAWCASPDANFGNRGAYVFDIETQTYQTTYPSIADQETGSICLNNDGRVVGFTITIRDDQGRLLEQQPWRWERQPGSSAYHVHRLNLDNDDWHWCQDMSISKNGKYQVWSASNYLYSYWDYILQGSIEGAEIIDLTGWSIGDRTLWPAVNNHSNIVYGRKYSDYVPFRTDFYSRDHYAIFHPGNTSRDFEFEN